MGIASDPSGMWRPIFRPFSTPAPWPWFDRPDSVHHSDRLFAPYNIQAKNLYIYNQCIVYKDTKNWTYKYIYMDYRIDKQTLLNVLEQWNQFLRRKVHLIACGGTAMTLFQVKPSTKDVDFMIPRANEYGYLIKALKSRPDPFSTFSKFFCY